jgi:hypothetical protein
MGPGTAVLKENIFVSSLASLAVCVFSFFSVSTSQTELILSLFQDIHKDSPHLVPKDGTHDFSSGCLSPEFFFVSESLYHHSKDCHFHFGS